jgi:cytochrome b subunit of formate dehydrogenase
MNSIKTRYKKMEAIVTGVLCVDTVIFVTYLLFAGSGMVAMKAVTAIFALLISGAVLYFLYMTRELLRRRSIWMTLAAACIVLCLIASLILHFPAPVFVLS